MSGHADYSEIRARRMAEPGAQEAHEAAKAELVVLADETLTGRAEAQGLVSRLARDARKTGLPPEFDPYLTRVGR